SGRHGHSFFLRDSKERVGSKSVWKPLVKIGSECGLPQKRFLSCSKRLPSIASHELIVLGTKAWSGDLLHFGHSAEALIGKAPGLWVGARQWKKSRNCIRLSLKPNMINALAT